MDFCPKEKSVPKNWVSQKLGPKSVLKIRSLTTETLLICKKVATTYVAWTNVIMIVGIC